ncbi:hypothetical protein CAEBREN_28307 [Caenorhabditis brenneri]|uniref:Uncharacterized protein n=1 Tax=Caenorhabditis brenneri TaxID=135651 RepID=G0P4Z0_CAEBE|nr:hypothetical protein CAEBREN_28307 [Caenorhabditis brenneri]
MSVDTIIVDSYIQLTNYFAANFGGDIDSISSLNDLWQKQGCMIAQMMGCDTKVFSSSDLFYEVIHRKIRMMNGSLAEALDPRKAATGDTLEICKFFALYLEFLRKDYSSMLTEYLEKLAAKSGFNSAVVLETFAFFDNLYETDRVDNWWECLTGTSDPDPEAASGFRTPRRNNSFSSAAFTTPTATARRLRTATSTARRSPIAEAVDSPTMKFMRSERELKQAKNRIRETEQLVEDLENENRALKEENRKFKISVDDLKSNVTAKRESAEDAEQRSQDLTAQLEESHREQTNLARQLEETRNTLRTRLRQLEELEAEKEKLVSKSSKTQEDLDKCLKDLRKTRDNNEQEFEEYRRKERYLNDQLIAKTNENNNLLELLTSVESLKSSLHADNERLNSKIEELSLDWSRTKQDADNAKTQLIEERERHQKQMEKLQQEKLERSKMADETIARLQTELNDKIKEKEKLDSLLSDLHEKILKDDKSTHEQNEQFLNARALLEATKRREEMMQIDLHSKEQNILVLKGQLEETQVIIRNSVLIRDTLNEQYKNNVAELNEKLSAKEKEVDLLKENMENLVLKHEKELTLRDEEIKARGEESQVLSQEFERLQQQFSEAKQKNIFMEERIKLLEEMPRERCLRSSSPDSLTDFLAADGENMPPEELKKIVDQTPRKSIAFNLDLNGDDTFRGTPIGFRAEPRESICSIDFDRNSTARSSLRSDTFTIASASEFKQPFTPSGPNKERVGVLTARNEKVRPHLQSAYAIECGESNSPSANEENVRKGGGKSTNSEEQKPKKKRRDSILSTLTFGKLRND